MYALDMPVFVFCHVLKDKILYIEQERTCEHTHVGFYISQAKQLVIKCTALYCYSQILTHAHIKYLS